MSMPKTLATSIRGKYTTITSANKVARSARRFDASASWTVAAPITKGISSLSSHWSECRLAVAVCSMADHDEGASGVEELYELDGTAVVCALR